MAFHGLSTWASKATLLVGSDDDRIRVEADKTANANGAPVGFGPASACARQSPPQRVHSAERWGDSR
jgi:hypothetical protein